MGSLKDAYSALPPTPVAPNAKKNLSSEIEIKDRGEVVEATVNLAADDASEPEGHAKSLLEKHGLDPAQYEVTGLRSSTWTMMGGEEGESTRFTFAKKGSAAANGGQVVMPDLDDLHAMVQRERVKAPSPTKKVEEDTTVIVCVSDLQIGKVDVLGGTDALLERLERSREGIINYIKRVKPREVLIADLGDVIEGFENVAVYQDRTNDAQLTEMIRIGRRIMWSILTSVSNLAPSVKMISVPSNHCAVRRSKARCGTPGDDFGIEILAQVADMAKVAGKKMEHVKFYVPSRFEETLAIETVGGLVVGFAHGHQTNNVNGIERWLSNQAAGRTPVGCSDLVLFGHYHHLRVAPWGSDRCYMITPSSDGGSSWFASISGQSSKPGVAIMTVGPNGWRDLDCV